MSKPDMYSVLNFKVLINRFKVSNISDKGEKDSGDGISSTCTEDSDADGKKLCSTTYEVAGNTVERGFTPWIQKTWFWMEKCAVRT